MTGARIADVSDFTLELTSPVISWPGRGGGSPANATAATTAMTMLHRSITAGPFGFPGAVRFSGIRRRRNRTSGGAGSLF